MYRMIINRIGWFIIAAGWMAAVLLLPATSPASTPVSLDAILQGLEKRYDGNDFSVWFFQISTLKAMEIQETASGKLLVKRPDKMRWEYDKPDKQTIISDGDRLWIYRPDDNQVLVGRSPSFFGEGKGAGFLSDIKSVRKNFSISLESDEAGKPYLLKLIPNNKTQELSRVLLVVSPDTYEVGEVITYNQYDDETRIELEGYRYSQNLNDELFRFEVPDGVDVLKMEQ